MKKRNVAAIVLLLSFMITGCGTKVQPEKTYSQTPTPNSIYTLTMEIINENRKSTLIPGGIRVNDCSRIITDTYYKHFTARVSPGICTTSEKFSFSNREIIDQYSQYCQKINGSFKNIDHNSYICTKMQENESPLFYIKTTSTMRDSSHHLTAYELINTEQQEKFKQLLTNETSYTTESIEEHLAASRKNGPNGIIEWSSGKTETIIRIGDYKSSKTYTLHLSDKRKVALNEIQEIQLINPDGKRTLQITLTNGETTIDEAGYGYMWMFEPHNPGRSGITLYNVIEMIITESDPAYSGRPYHNTVSLSQIKRITFNPKSEWENLDSGIITDLITDNDRRRVAEERRVKNAVNSFNSTAKLNKEIGVMVCHSDNRFGYVERIENKRIQIRVSGQALYAEDYAYFTESYRKYRTIQLNNIIWDIHTNWAPCDIKSI